MTTLSTSTTTIAISDDLNWADEYAWSSVEQSVERGLTGSSIVQTGVRLNGRPITLAPDSDATGWLQRSTVDALYGLANVPGQVLTLTYRGTPRQVLFRHHDGNAIEASPVIPYSDVEPDDYYRVTLRFIEL
jgi:hypothetical protein